MAIGRTKAAANPTCSNIKTNTVITSRGARVTSKTTSSTSTSTSSRIGRSASTIESHQNVTVVNTPRGATVTNVKCALEETTSRGLRVTDRVVRDPYVAVQNTASGATVFNIEKISYADAETPTSTGSRVVNGVYGIGCLVSNALVITLNPSGTPALPHQGGGDGGQVYVVNEIEAGQFATPSRVLFIAPLIPGAAIAPGLCQNASNHDVDIRPEHVEKGKPKRVALKAGGSAACDGFWVDCVGGKTFYKITNGCTGTYHGKRADGTAIITVCCATALNLLYQEWKAGPVDPWP